MHEKLREFLKARKIRQATLSRASTIRTDTLSLLVRGKVVISDYQLQRIERGLYKIPGVDPEDIESLINNMKEGLQNERKDNIARVSANYQRPGRWIN